MRKLYQALFSCILLFATNVAISQTVTVGTGTSVQRFPLNYFWGFGRSSMIYTAAEMGTTGGAVNVTSIAFECNTAANTGPTVVYLKEVGTTTTQSSVTWATKITGATTVYTGTPGNTTGWRVFTFPSPFLLNANQNLEVMVECNFGGSGTGGSAGNDVRYSTVTTGHQFWQQDGSAPTGTGSTSSNRPNIQFVFAPPPSCTAPPTGGTTNGPAGSVCQGTNFTLSVTGASVGLGITYQWQSSPNGSTWTDIGGQTSGGLTTTQTATTYYRRKITCSGIDDFSTPFQVVNQASIVSTFPWSENFDGLTTLGSTSFPCGWVKENGDWRSANNASSSFDANALSAPNFIQIPWSAVNEYIWSPGFVLTAGTQYDFKFWYADYDASSTWVGDVFVNTTANSAGATQVGTSFIENGTAAPTTYTEVKRSFTPTANGTYYFAIRVNEPTGGPWYLSFDNFSLSEVPAADVGAIAITTPTVYCPDPAFSNLEATIQNFGAAPIDFSVNPVTVTVTVGGAGSGTLTGTLNSGTLALGATTNVSLSPAFAFSNSGTYTFQVVATAVGDGNATNSTFNGSKFINNVPVVNLGADVNQCTNTGIVLSANTQPAGSSYVWNTGATTPTLTATATGQYYLTVTSPLINGPGTKTFTTNTPVGIFDLQTVNSTQAVSGLTRTTMSATSINQVCINITHTWNSDMDIQLVSPSGTIMDLSIGNGGSGDNYTNTCFSPSASVPIFSGSSPFTGTFLPEESFTVFNGQNPNGNWSLRVTDFFNGDQGTINSWFIVFNDSVATPGTGCSAADTINATVRPVPLVDLGPDAIVCAGGTKTLNPGTQPTGSTFLWNNNATTSTLVAASTGLYWVEVTNSQACAKRDSINVTVIAPIVTTLNLPFDTLYVNSPITTLSGGSPAGTGGVYSGVGISGTSINPAAFPQGNHQVTYTFTDANGCVGTASDVFTIVANTANKVNLFPNPSTGGNFRMVVAADFVGAFVTAYDQTGHKMGSWTLGGKLNDYSLDWPSGRYTLIIRNSAGVEVQKQLIIVK
ncbi:MAG: proprotein convertase P-domain-containing protein [Chitinophagaceae bacterium]|nr:proprotein convertase P-domain-containing protein [Chitinophagaceae bacterium]